MARASIVGVLLVVCLLALATGVEAKRDGNEAPRGNPPEHAKAHGLAKREQAPPAEPPAPPAAPPASDTPPVTQAPPVAEAPPPTEPPAASAPPATSAAPSTHASPVAFHAHAPVHADSAPAAPVPAASSLPEPTNDPEPTAPVSTSTSRALEAPAPDEVADTRTATFGAGAATTRAPGWAGDALPSPSSASDGSAPWWVHLAWALPLVGVGGVAAVLVVRHKTRAPMAQLVTRDSRMAPVSPDDLKGILQNGHVAAARGALDEAVAWFERALRLQPELGVAYFCKGVCLAANGRVSDAYGALRTACEVEPADATYRVHFARVALAVGKHKEAMDSLEYVARAAPELGPAMLEDPQLAGLRDHPRFLMICGAL